MNMNQVAVFPIFGARIFSEKTIEEISSLIPDYLPLSWDLQANEGLLSKQQAHLINYLKIHTADIATIAEGLRPNSPLIIDLKSYGVLPEKFSMLLVSLIQEQIKNDSVFVVVYQVSNTEYATCHVYEKIMATHLDEMCLQDFNPIFDQSIAA